MFADNLGIHVLIWQYDMTINSIKPTLYTIRPWSMCSFEKIHAPGQRACKIQHRLQHTAVVLKACQVFCVKRSGKKIPWSLRHGSLCHHCHPGRLPCVTSPSGRECWLQGRFWQCLRLCGPPQEVQDAEDAVQNGEATANPTGCRSKTLESMCEFDVFARTIRIVAGLTSLNLMYKQYW